MNEVMNLFQGATRSPAIILAVAAFVLGVVCLCIVCKVFGSCGKTACGKSIGKASSRKAEEKPFEKRKPHPAPADGSIEIYVGNLSYDMTEEQLRQAFEAHGKVNVARLVTERRSGRSKGFGFVQMPDRAEAEKAIAALNDPEVMGRKMRCNVAKNLI